MEIGLALPQFDFSVTGECPLRWDTVVAWAQRFRVELHLPCSTDE